MGAESPLVMAQNVEVLGRKHLEHKQAIFTHVLAAFSLMIYLLVLFRKRDPVIFELNHRKTNSATLAKYVAAQMQHPLHSVLNNNIIKMCVPVTGHCMFSLMSYATFWRPQVKYYTLF